MLVEVNNVRYRIYPETAEFYDLHDKAARLQVAYPGHPFVPVLLCRRGHATTLITPTSSSISFRPRAPVLAMRTTHCFRLDSACRTRPSPWTT
jgi:hypothetical protein